MKEYTKFREDPYRHSDADVCARIQRKEQSQITFSEPSLFHTIHSSQIMHGNVVFQCEKYFCCLD